MSKLEPLTREEHYLSAIAGETELPADMIALTRIEKYLKKILDNGTGGGGGSGDATYWIPIVYDSSEEYFYLDFDENDFADKWGSTRGRLPIKGIYEGSTTIYFDFVSYDGANNIYLCGYAVASSLDGSMSLEGYISRFNFTKRGGRFVLDTSGGR